MGQDGWYLGGVKYRALYSASNCPVWFADEAGKKDCLGASSQVVSNQLMVESGAGCCEG